VLSASSVTSSTSKKKKSSRLDGGSMAPPRTRVLSRYARSSLRCSPLISSPIAATLDVTRSARRPRLQRRWRRGSAPARRSSIPRHPRPHRRCSLRARTRHTSTSTSALLSTQQKRALTTRPGVARWAGVVAEARRAQGKAQKGDRRYTARSEGSPPTAPEYWRRRPGTRRDRTRGRVGDIEPSRRPQAIRGHVGG
jgi:hypothetical protein